MNISINVDEYLLLLVKFCLSGCASKASKPWHINEARFHSHVSPRCMRELLRGLNTGLFKVFWRVKKLCGFFFLNTYTHTSTVFMINQKSWWCMGIYCWALVRYSRQHGTQRRLICYGWSHSWAAQLSLWCTWLAHLVANWKVGGSNSPRDNLVFFSGTCEQPCFRNLLLFCEALLQRSLNWSAKSHPRYLLKPQVPGP